MNSRRALVLHKTEWDRIRRKQNDGNIHSNEDYIKSLNEISQSWLKSWPDTVEGRVHLVEKQKENQQVKNVAFIKDYSFKKKEFSHGEKIKEAREQIFRDSCYGRRLLSALLESRTLEERDIQIEFQKKIKEEAKIRDKNEFLCNSIESAFDMEKKELSSKLRQRENNIQMAKFNAAISYNMQEKQRNENQRNKMLETADVRYNKSLIAQEEREEEKHKRDTRNAIETFVREQKDIKEKKKHQETEILKNIEMIQEYQDRVNWKIKAMNNKIIKERFSDRTEKVYKQLQILKEEEQRRYEKFVETGIQRQLSKEAESKQHLNQAIKSKFVVQETENMIKTKDFDPIYNKYLSNRQCIITKSCKDKKNTKNNKWPKTDSGSAVFLFPPKKLVEEYRQRLQEPQAWSGLRAAHAQFAEHATNVLRECRYKHVARNIVDEYRRINCLDEETIPIHYYNN